MRTTPLITGEYYHIFNKGLNDNVIFLNEKACQRALLLLWFNQYQHTKSFSVYLNSSIEIQRIQLEIFSHQNPKVTVIAFSLMPNHYHLVLKQQIDGGISKYVGDFQNAITKYINTKHRNQGPVFIPRFKAVHIDNNEQLLHVVRYVHLNMLVGNVVPNMSQLLNHPNSSLYDYTTTTNQRKHGFVHPEIVLNQFSSTESYVSFTSDHANYQRSLHYIKKLSHDWQ